MTPTTTSRARLCCALAAAGLLAATAPIAGQAPGLRLPALIGDRMVLQRDVPVAIWGWAAPGAAVSVSIGGQTVSAGADGQGRWRAWLAPLAAGGPHDLVVRADREITVRDVLVGDVWVGSGQSNMEWPVEKSAKGQEEIAAASFPRIRLFTVPRTVADSPQDDVAGTWAAVTPETVRSFSAVAYFFGRELHGRLRVPIGLVHSSWGGSPAEAWTSREALAARPGLQPVLLNWQRNLLAWPVASAAHPRQIAEWEAASARARERGEPPPPRPPAPQGPGHFWTPSGLYNAMIAPLARFAIRGVIWYQGESNANAYRSYEYRELFPVMIEDWRAAWNQGPFPFVFVQLANFRERRAEPVESHWAELREAQLHTLRSVTNTGMAVTIDLGEADDIHPTNKQDVGRRLALEARRLAYGEPIVSAGPIYRGMRLEPGGIRLSFDNVGGGLVSRTAPLASFTVAGRDGRFVNADARIDGKTVIVSSAAVPYPIAARYAWQDNPEASLYNRDGLPATPFRTDSWTELNRPR